MALQHGLASLRVIDLSSNLCGPYATKLLADGGADVIKIESPLGDPLRRWSATGADLGDDDSAIFRFLNTTKRSMVGAVGEPEVEALLRGADIVVEDLGPAGSGPDAIDIDALRARHPHLIVLSISPFGAGGPLSAKPSTELIVQAESGALIGRGRPDQPPIQAGGRISDWTAACYAAPAALAASMRARRTGVGEHIDLSIAEVMAIAASTFSDLANHLSGRPPLETVPRNLETPSIHRAADGWIGFNTNTAQMFQSFLIMIERFDLLEDAELASLSGRVKRLAEWEGIVEEWTTKHTCADVMQRAAELRIPCSRVNDGRSVLENEQLQARGVFVPNPAGFLQPRSPYLVEGESPRPFAPAPRLGEHTGRVEARERPAPTDPGADPFALPLTGVKVLDLTSWWAGPSSSHLLGLFGAEVIHVESTAHPDGMRLTGFMFGRPDWWEWGHMFAAANTNKLDVTLDVGQPQGLELCKRLVQWADVVVENFAPRVVEQWGLDADAVLQLNPDIVYLRMPAFGLSGPWRDRTGFAQTMEQLTGMAWITGHPYDQPRILRGPCDPIAGMHGALAMLIGLHEREHRGAGVFIESTMVEAALNCAAEQIVECTAYGNLMERAGNRSPHCAPQGVYACPGFEQWLAISVETDEQWKGLVEALGAPSWALDAALASRAGRHAAHDLLDAELGAWAAARDLDTAVALLVAHGVPAARLWDPRIQSRHPQMAARSFYEELDHPSLGRHPVPGLPFRWTTVDRWTRRATPTLGQDNDDVLRRILGLGDDEIAALAEAGVIGQRPRGM
jgi:crotonobetainyl-CoA:carnitine CoA-transferase CaiB-like acyl-CoA transferase